MHTSIGTAVHFGSNYAYIIAVILHIKKKKPHHQLCTQ